MRRTIALSIALCFCSSAAADQLQYRNTRIQPRPVPPEQEVHIPAPRIQLRAPVTARVARAGDESPAAAAPAQAPVAAPAAVAEEPKHEVSDVKVNPTAVAPGAAVAPQQPTRRTYRAPQQQRGFFGQIMEIERRKNAWIRRTFFN